MNQWEEWECIPTWKIYSNSFSFINNHNQLCIDDNTSYNSDCEGDFSDNPTNHETPLIHGPYTLDELSFFE